MSNKLFHFTWFILHHSAKQMRVVSSAPILLHWELFPESPWIICPERVHSIYGDERQEQSLKWQKSKKNCLPIGLFHEVSVQVWEKDQVPKKEHSSRGTKSSHTSWANHFQAPTELHTTSLHMISKDRPHEKINRTKKLRHKKVRSRSFEAHQWWVAEWKYRKNRKEGIIKNKVKTYIGIKIQVLWLNIALVQKKPTLRWSFKKANRREKVCSFPRERTKIYLLAWKNQTGIKTFISNTSLQRIINYIFNVLRKIT